MADLQSLLQAALKDEYGAGTSAPDFSQYGEPLQSAVPIPQPKPKAQDSSLGLTPVDQRVKRNYPVLQDQDYTFVQSPEEAGKGRVLESWPANDPGTSDAPRPGSIPMDKFGVETFGDSVSTKDIAGDIVSHDLVKRDPNLKGLYDKFSKTFSTPEARKRLRQDYEYAKENEGETRPFKTWAETTRIPAYFRGYVFKQWPEKAFSSMYTPEQRKLLDQAVGYIGDGTPSPRPKPDNPSSPVDLSVYGQSLEQEKLPPINGDKQPNRQPVRVAGIPTPTPKPDIRGVLGDIGRLTPEEQISTVESQKAAAEQQVQRSQSRADKLKKLQKIDLGTNPDIEAVADLQRSEAENDPIAVSNAPDAATVRAGQRVMHAEDQLAGRAPLPTQTPMRNAIDTGVKSFLNTGTDIAKAGGIVAGAVPGIPEENAITRIADAAEEEVRKAFPGDDTQSETFAAALAQGSGSMAGFLLSSVITSAAGRVVGLSAKTSGTVGAAGAGAAVQGTQGYEEAAAKGAGALARYTSFLLNAGLGATEAVPIDRFFMRLNKVSNGRVARILANTKAQSLEEFTQEVMQQVGSDAVAKAIYDPDREIGGEDALMQGIIGGILGGAMGGAGSAAFGGQTAGEEDIQPVAAPEQPDQQSASPRPGPAADVEAGAAAPVDEPPVEEQAAPAAPASADQRAVLRKYGYTDADIDTMSPEERAPEVADALAAGVQADDAEKAAAATYEAEKGDGSKAAPVKANTAADVETAAAVAQPDPTDAQKEAGNYKKGHVKAFGLDITIENQKGSERTGMDTDGEQWRTVMPAHYGYVKKTEGADGDQVDVYLGDNLNSDRVYVVDQIDPATGKFDEHKAVLGANSMVDAGNLYRNGFSDGSGLQRIGSITEIPLETFRNWLKSGDTAKPFTSSAAAREAISQMAQAEGQGLVPQAQPGEAQADESVLPAQAVRQRPGPTEQGIIGFIRGAGGLRPDAELTALELGRSRPGTVSNRGRSLDQMREAAAEAGYFDHLYGTRENAIAQSTPDDLVQLVRSQIAGTPALSMPDAQDQASTMGMSPAQQAEQDFAEGEANAQIDALLQEYDFRLDDELRARAMQLLMTGEEQDADSAIERAAIMLENEIRAEAADEGADLAPIPGWTDDEIRQTAAPESTAGTDQGVEEARQPEPGTGAEAGRRGAQPDAAGENGGEPAGQGGEQSDENGAEQGNKEAVAPAATKRENQADLSTEAKTSESTDRPKLESGKSVALGPTSFPLKPLPAGDYFRETSPSGVGDLLAYPGAGRSFVSNDPDLAIGQGRNKGVMVRLRGDALSGNRVRKPGIPADASAQEYEIDFVGEDAINEIVLPKSGIRDLRLIARRILKQNFDRTDLPDGRVRFLRKGVEDKGIVGQSIVAEQPVAEEVGADNKAQAILPGAEKATDADLAQRRADLPLKPKREQKAADEGLFGDEKDQMDLVDQARRPEKPKTEPNAQRSPEPDLPAKKKRHKAKAKQETAPDDADLATAYHGSPHDFDQFSTEHIGSGEGAQAYGWGLYFSSRKEVAKFYRDNLSERKIKVFVNGNDLGENGSYEEKLLYTYLKDAYVNGVPNPVDYASIELFGDNNIYGKNYSVDENGKSAYGRALDIINSLNEGDVTFEEENGRLFEVDIPENNELLDWDKPLNEQPEGVKEKLRLITAPKTDLFSKAIDKFRADRLQDTITDMGDKVTGDDLYGILKLAFGSDAAASKALQSVGIPGHRYLDQVSRGKGKGTYNYVIYDDSRISVERKYSKKPSGWDTADTGASSRLTDKQTAEVRKIVREVAGMNTVHMPERIDIPQGHAGAQAWGNEGGGTASGYYDPTTDVVAVAMSLPDGRRAAFHESFHRLQNLFLSEREKALLRAEGGRLRDLLRGDDIRGGQVDKMSQKEVEAEAFAVYALRSEADPAAGARGVHIGLRRAWNRIMQVVRRVRNYLSGNGYQTYEDVFAAAKRGEVAQRPAASGAGDRQFSVQPERKTEVGAFDTPSDVRYRHEIWMKRVGGILASMPTIEQVRRKVQDRFLIMRRYQEQIAKQFGLKELSEPFDVYQAESLYYGRAGERIAELREKVIDPLIESMREKGVSHEQLALFLYAKHARERNATIAERNEDMPDGGSGMTNAEADAVLADFEGAGLTKTLEQLAGQVYKMNREALQLRYSAGLLSKEQYDQLKDRWKFYVPLRGYEGMGEAIEGERVEGPRTGQGYQARGKEFKAALGRGSLADSPLAYSIMNSMESIVRAEKNRVGKTFLRLVQAFPNKAVWEVKKAEVRRRLNPTSGLVEDYIVPLAFTNDQQVFSVKVGGNAMHIVVKDPRLIRALKNMGSADMSAPVRALSKFTRFYASLQTSWNPEFVLTNFARDMETALGYLGEHEIKGLRWQVTKNAFQAMKGMFRNLHGKTDDYWTKAAKRYRDAGGKISFFEYQNIETLKEGIEKDLNRGRVGRIRRKLMDNLVEIPNGAVENALRLATFDALIKAGMTEAKAASAARELTVNFNRKGEYGSVINAFYVFFNASLQGNVRLIQLAVKSKAVRKAIIATAIFGFIMDMLGAWSSDDDDETGKSKWDLIPEWERTRSIIVPGTGASIKIPLAYGFNIPYVFGQELSRVVRGASNPIDAATTMLGTFAETMSPVGGAPSFLQFVAPTILEPAAQLAENKNWLGNPIMPSRGYYDTRPDSQLAFDSVAPGAKWLAEALNSVTGGSKYEPGMIDVSPETLELFTDFLTGGLGRTLSRSVKTGQAVLFGTGLEPNDIPFARVFYRGESDYVKRNMFYDAREQAQAAHNAVRAMQKDRRPASEVRDYKKRHAAELSAYNAFKAANKQLRELRAQRRQVEQNSSISLAQRKAKVDQIRQKELKVMMKAQKVYLAAKERLSKQ